MTKKLQSLSGEDEKKFLDIKIDYGVHDKSMIIELITFSLLALDWSKKNLPKIEEGYKDTVKACASALTMTVNLCGHLGRGITAAASKISGSVWKRLFTTEM